MKPTRSILLGVITLGILTACDSGNKIQSTAPAKSKIFVSNYPLAYFAQRITDDNEEIYFPLIDGDPAFWMPSPEDITKVQQCNPLLLNGATYEKWRSTVTLPEGRIIDTSSSFQNQFIKITDVVTHQHGPDGDHSHGGTVFTTWLDFSQAIKQAQTIKNSLDNVIKGSSSTLEKNFKLLIEDLGTLDQDLRSLTSKKPDQSFVASHPIYQYFARAYDLDIHYVLWEPDVYPNEKQWQALEKDLATHPAKWMIWEGPPLEKSVQRLKKMGLDSVVFDPCANTPGSGDFLSTMKQNIENLRPVFSP